MLLLLAGDIFLFKLYRKEIHRKKLWKDNYLTEHEIVKIYQTKQGIWTTQAKDYNFRISDLKSKIDIKDSIISRLKYVIVSQDKKLKEVKDVLFATLHSEGQGTAPLKDSITGIGIGFEIAETDFRYAYINDGYLAESLFIYPDTVKYDYDYEESINVLVTRVRKLTKKGNKACFLWRWLRPWDDATNVFSSNPNSKIISAIKIKVEK
jgi:hypothetical protein